MVVSYGKPQNYLQHKYVILQQHVMIAVKSWLNKTNKLDFDNCHLYFDCQLIKFK